MSGIDPGRVGVTLRRMLSVLTVTLSLGVTCEQVEKWVTGGQRRRTNYGKIYNTCPVRGQRSYGDFLLNGRPIGARNHRAMGRRRRGSGREPESSGPLPHHRTCGSAYGGS